MLDLIRSMAATPESQTDPYVWAAALTGHFAVGLILVATVAALIDALADEWIEGPQFVAWAVVTVVYLVAWEGVIQGLGAGVWDALVDTFAVSVGGAVGILAWRRKGVAVAALVLAFLAVLWRGVRR